MSECLGQKFNTKLWFRKSERNRKNEQSCVLANPLAKEDCENVKQAEQAKEKRVLTPEGNHD